MDDPTYPLRVLKHKFAKTAWHNEGATASIAAILGMSIMSGGIFLAVDKDEDNIQSEQAPQAMQRINNEMQSLTAQKQNISAIKKQIKGLEFSAVQTDINNLQKQANMVAADFKDGAENTLDYILTNTHLSEQQTSELWDKFSQNLATPESINDVKYDNNYDFGFLSEAKEVAMSNIETELMSELSSNITTEIKSQEDIKALSILGLFGFLLMLPSLAFSNSNTVRKWEREKPKKRKNTNSQFKH